MVASPPPSPPNSGSSPTISNTDALKALGMAITSAANKVNKSVVSFLNPVNRLVATFKTAEKLQLQALSMGTTYKKFTEANTAALAGNTATNQEMTSFLMQGFSKGLRDMSVGTKKLADEMIITGQDTGGLIDAMASLRSTTNASKKVGGILSKSILKNSKTFGVTSENMVDALNSVKSSLERAAVYGDDAVGAYGEFTTDMVAAMGGSDDAKRNVQTFLTMAGSLEVGNQAMFGITEEMKALRSGTNVSSRMLEKLVAFDKKLGSSEMQRDSMILQLGEKNSLAALGMLRALKKQNKLTDEQKKAQSDNLKSIANAKRDYDNFYQQLAPDTYEKIVTWLPAIGIGVAAMAAKGTATKVLSTMAPAAAGAASVGGLAAIKAVGKGVARMIPLLGAGFLAYEAYKYFTPKLVKAANATEANTKKTTEEAKKAADKSRELRGNTLSRAAVLASGLVTGNTTKEAKKTHKLLEDIAKAIRENPPNTSKEASTEKQ